MISLAKFAIFGDIAISPPDHPACVQLTAIPLKRAVWHSTDRGQGW